MQASKVAGKVVQQVPEHLVAEPQSATCSLCPQIERLFGVREGLELVNQAPGEPAAEIFAQWQLRSEEHTSELQSRRDLVCRLLLEKKKQKQKTTGSKQKQRIKNQSDWSANTR